MKILKNEYYESTKIRFWPNRATLFFSSDFGSKVELRYCTNILCKFGIKFRKVKFQNPVIGKGITSNNIRVFGAA